MQFSLLAGLAAVVSIGLSKPMPTERQMSTTRTNSARDAKTTICGELMAYANGGDTMFYASDVHACLESVPFNADPALRFLRYYNTTLQFQSTLAFLKDPPAGYQQPAINVEGILARIGANVTAGYYKNQYEFEADVQRLTFALHDAHVDLRQGILSPFSFASPYYISSVSVDGKEPPKLYLTNDIIAAQANAWSWMPSAIVNINGEDAVDYVTKFASANSLGRLESHAEWNDMMTHPTLDVLGADSIFSGQATFYPGDDLVFTFENKSEPLKTYWLSYYNYLYDTGPISTGGDMYNFFVLGLHPATNESDSYSVGDRSLTTRQDGPDPSSDDNTSWYPESSGAYPDNPDVHQPDLLINGGGVVTGYYLDDISTGVLSIPSFDLYGDYITNFSVAVQDFIDGAQKAKLEHIVIDLQQNSGGVVVLAYDTFSRFFPTTAPFGGTRRRSHVMGNALGRVTTDWWNTLDPNNDTEVYNWELGFADEWVITSRLNAATGETFRDWAEYAGPLSTKGDEFTLVEKYNLSNIDFDYEALGMAPYGWGDNPAHTSQVWKPEDIIILTDGLCSSTCSLFVEFMTSQGVRTVVMGGRPETGPMQAVSGTRGARAYWGDDLDNQMTWASKLDEEANQTLPTFPANSEFRDTGIWTTYTGFNLRDQIHKDDVSNADAIPLQFQYQAASCRLYYTMHNLYNMTQQWRDAAASIWTDTSLCVQDSTGYSTTGTTTAAKPPPTPNTATQFRPFADMASTAPVEFSLGAGSGEDFCDADDDEDDDAADYLDADILLDGGTKQSRDKITECLENNGEYYCQDSTRQCVPMNVKCRNTVGKVTKSVPVRACLPVCNEKTDCKPYDENLSLTCPKYTAKEKKLSAKLTGHSNGNGTSPVVVRGKTYTGLCQPEFGTKDLGNCPL